MTCIEAEQSSLNRVLALAQKLQGQALLVARLRYCERGLADREVGPGDAGKATKAGDAQPAQPRESVEPLLVESLRCSEWQIRSERIGGSFRSSRRASRARWSGAIERFFTCFHRGMCSHLMN